MTRRAVLVVCDSLRADMVDAATSPTLARFRDEAAHFTAFRGVFPSTTRTSAASIATGCLPAGHGLLGNTMVLDDGEGLTCFSAGKPDFHRAETFTYGIDAIRN
jgi:predicted AlkP superfamily pyrophosphatase or phosphodiesterase